MIDHLCFLAYKLCMLFVLRFPWLQCNSKELWFMRISKSGLRKFSVIYLVLICCIPCTGKSVDSHEITEKLYTVYTIPSWMSYSWDPVLSSSWKTSTKNNFKSLHFLLYKCFLWLWETGCAKKKKNVQLMLLPGFDNYLFGFLDNCCGTAFSTCRACRWV